LGTSELLQRVLDNFRNWLTRDAVSGFHPGLYNSVNEIRIAPVLVLNIVKG
jgi:hypothetical protein